jgi:SAM-dependent methyltransferase
MSADPHDTPTPSAWVTRWAHCIPAGGRVLDLACGNGRHARHLAGLGYSVEAVDRNPGIRDLLAGVPGVDTRVVDLEGGGWPYWGQQFAGVVVTNYLHRPLVPLLLDILSFGGVLIYETFALGNAQFGKPSNPAYLLQPGELLEAARNRLRVIAYEDVVVSEPRPAAVQRMCGVRFL